MVVAMTVCALEDKVRENLVRKEHPWQSASQRGVAHTSVLTQPNAVSQFGRFRFRLGIQIMHQTP
jgi:hypothetical protein